MVCSLPVRRLIFAHLGRTISRTFQISLPPRKTFVGGARYVPVASVQVLFDSMFGGGEFGTILCART